MRDSDPQSMSPKRHSPRTRYHSNRLSFSLRDSLRADVSSVIRDVMAPARGWGKQSGVTEGLGGMGGTGSEPGCWGRGVHVVFKAGGEKKVWGYSDVPRFRYSRSVSECKVWPKGFISLYRN